MRSIETSIRLCSMSCPIWVLSYHHYSTPALWSLNWESLKPSTRLKLKCEISRFFKASPYFPLSSLLFRCNRWMIVMTQIYWYPSELLFLFVVCFFPSPLGKADTFLAGAFHVILEILLVALIFSLAVRLQSDIFFLSVDTTRIRTNSSTHDSKHC